MDESSFTAMFEDVPKLAIYSPKDIAENMTKIKEVIANVGNDWDKRVDSVSECTFLHFFCSDFFFFFFRKSKKVSLIHFFFLSDGIKAWDKRVDSVS